MFTGGTDKEANREAEVTELAARMNPLIADFL
jgi:hypothetical protein